VTDRVQARALGWADSGSTRADVMLFWTPGEPMVVVQRTAVSASRYSGLAWLASVTRLTASAGRCPTPAQNPQRPNSADLPWTTGGHRKCVAVLIGTGHRARRGWNAAWRLRELRSTQRTNGNLAGRARIHLDKAGDGNRNPTAVGCRGDELSGPPQSPSAGSCCGCRAGGPCGGLPAALLICAQGFVPGQMAVGLV
jgi:hypothetical protein